MDFGNIRGECDRLKQAWLRDQNWDGDAWFNIMAELSSADMEMQKDVLIKYVVDAIGCDVPRPVFDRLPIYNGGRDLYNCISTSLSIDDVSACRHYMGRDYFDNLPVIVGNHELLEPRVSNIIIPRDRPFAHIRHYYQHVYGHHSLMVISSDINVKNEGHYGVASAAKKIIFVGGASLNKLKDVYYSSVKKIEFRGSMDPTKKYSSGIIDVDMFATTTRTHYFPKNLEVSVVGWDKPSILSECVWNQFKLITFENVTFPHHGQKAFAQFMSTAIGEVGIINCEGYKHIINACDRRTREKIVVL